MADGVLYELPAHIGIDVVMVIYVKWLGHASFQIKAVDKVIYIDLKKYGKVVETSEKAGIILVTHDHSDHCSPLRFKSSKRKTQSLLLPKIALQD